jgi:hypothetical protein
MSDARMTSTGHAVSDARWLDLHFQVWRLGGCVGASRGLRERRGQLRLENTPIPSGLQSSGAEGTMFGCHQGASANYAPSPRDESGHCIGTGIGRTLDTFQPLGVLTRIWFMRKRVGWAV